MLKVLKARGPGAGASKLPALPGGGLKSRRLGGA